MAAKTQGAQMLATLFSTGTLSVDGMTATYHQRPGDGMVVGFMSSTDQGQWLTDACSNAGLSLIIVFVADDDFAAVVLTKLMAALGRTDAGTVTLCGAGAGAQAALYHAGAFAAPRLVAFDLPGVSDETLNTDMFVGGYVFFDPFHDAHDALRDYSNLQWLKCFGLMNQTVHALWRMKHLQGMLPAALLGELDAGFFYKQIRNRKNYRFYRQGMEDALARRGQTARQKQFRAAFRAHMDARDPDTQFAALQKAASDGRPANPDTWAGTLDWPGLGGNVWMLEKDADGLRYMSDRWQGVTMGFAERAGVTLAQTPPLALGMVSFGQAVQVERNLTRRFPWHVVGPNLSGAGPALGATAEATLLCEARFATQAGLQTVMCFDHPAPALSAVQAERGSAAYDAVIADVRRGHDALKEWGKSLFVDRVRLSLLAGLAPHSKADAAQHYATMAHDLCKDIAQMTGQISPPIAVVIQSAGSRTSGASEVILAEGCIDIDNPALSAIVASPGYPWPLMPDTPATPSAKAALITDELAHLAVAAVQSGGRWFCPLLRSAKLVGQNILSDFSSLDGLVLDDGPHGFHVLGGEAPVNITGVKVTSADTVTIQLDQVPQGDNLQLAYAWGHESDGAAGDKPANHGALRDKWSQPSQSVVGETLHRFALSACVPLRP